MTHMEQKLNEKALQYLLKSFYKLNYSAKQEFLVAMMLDHPEYLEGFIEALGPVDYKKVIDHV